MMIVNVFILFCGFHIVERSNSNFSLACVVLGQCHINLSQAEHELYESPRSQRWVKKVKAQEISQAWTVIS